MVVSAEPCPQDFSAGLSGACYFLSRERHTHSGCVDTCWHDHDSSSLACINSANESKFVSEFVARLVNSGDVWIGLYRGVVVGEASALINEGWACATGEPTNNFTSWTPNQPNDPAHNCAAVWSEFAGWL